MRRAAALAVAFAAFWAGAAAEPVALPPLAPVAVEVRRTGDSFVATLRLPRAAPVWGFFRSAVDENDKQPWRSRSFRILTPGVKLVRRNDIDALVATNGRAVPRTVRIAVEPYISHLVADYVPAMRMDRGLALFDGHFSLFSAPSLAVLDALTPALDDPRIGDGGTSVRFIAPARSLRIAGDVAGYKAGRSSGAYGLFDIPPASIANGVATVTDSDLPAWIAADLINFTPRVIGAMSARMGDLGTVQPTVIAAFERPDEKGASMNGGTLPGLIMMRFSGKDALEPLPALADMAHWFIAHEAAHFWLGQKVRYASPADAWIMEGGADLIAVRTVGSLDPAYDQKKTLNAALRDCSALAVKPIASAAERGEHRANYACGAVFSLVAERASGGDFHSFVRGLIESHRDTPEISAATWIAALDRASAKPVLGAQIDALLAKGSPDPASALAILLADAGIDFTRDSKGIPQL